MYEQNFSEVFSQALATNATSQIVNLALTVLLIVTRWIIYNKANENGWAAIIPFYSSYVMFKIAGKKKLFWPYLIGSLVLIGTVIAFIVEICALIVDAYSSYGGYMGDDQVLALFGGMGIVVLVMVIVEIVMFIFVILAYVGLVKNFGKSGGWAVGLIFLPHIFFSIMAFSKDIQYVGGYGDVPFRGGYNPYGQAPQYGQPQQPVYMNNQYGQQNPYGQAPQYGQQQNPYGQAPQYGQQQNPYGQAPQYGQQQNTYDNNNSNNNNNNTNF